METELYIVDLYHSNEKTLEFLNHFNYKQRDDMLFGIPKNTYSPDDTYKKFLPDSTIKVMESYLNIAKNI